MSAAHTTPPSAAGEHPSDRLMDRLSRAVDTALDRTVVLGYAAPGHAIRQLLSTWPEDPAPDALQGKHVIVTGATSGLGTRTATDLAALGAHVHLLVRDPARAAEVGRSIESLGRGAHSIWRCDLADLESVLACAAQLRAAVPALHAIVHNAGILPATRQTDSTGHELTMGVHVLGPILLTEELLPALGGQAARVIFVTSGGMYAQALELDDLDYHDQPYRGSMAYARSKRAQVELLPVLQRRWAPRGLAVYATHPGWAASPGVTTSLPVFAKVTAPVLRRGEAGVDTTTWLVAVEPRPAGGGLWHDRRQRPTSYLRRTRPTEAQRRRLWEWVATETGIPLG